MKQSWKIFNALWNIKIIAAKSFMIDGNKIHPRLLKITRFYLRMDSFKMARPFFVVTTI
jgi:hypothetical protein